MNENINLVEILEDCKNGTKFYSSAYGDLVLKSVCTTVCLSGYPIIFAIPDHSDVEYRFTKDGRCCKNGNGECCIFPSKEQRDWSKFKTPIKKFDPKTFQPFDKVFVRDYAQEWRADIFSNLIEVRGLLYASCIHSTWRMCIPYNEQTQHLVGTEEDCPEYYKWWED